MLDLKLQRTCDHMVFDEQLTVEGLSPSYYSELKFQCDGASGFVTVRELSRTEGLSNFVYSRDGFTNWRLHAGARQIDWNPNGFGGPGTGVASFMDGATSIFPEPVMLASYRAIATQCPTCVADGRALIKDVEFNQQGQLRTVTGNDKVRQIVFKGLLTGLGANEFAPGYGSGLAAIIGQKFDALAEFSIYQAITSTLQFLIAEQANNDALPLNEIITGVNTVTVSQDSTDPRRILVYIEIVTGDFKKVDINFNLVSA